MHYILASGYVSNIVQGRISRVITANVMYRTTAEKVPLFRKRKINLEDDKADGVIPDKIKAKQYFETTVKWVIFIKL